MANLIYKTDFETVTRIDANRIDMGIDNWFSLQNGGNMWIEGLERQSGITPHIGSRCIGMESLVSGGRAEFNLTNLQNLVGQEFYISVWHFLPSNWQSPNPAGQDYNWYEFINPYFGDRDVTPVPYYPYCPLFIREDAPDNFRLTTEVIDDIGSGQYRTVIAEYPNFGLPRGRWFKTEYYIYRHVTNGIVRIWLDNVLVCDRTGTPTNPIKTTNAEVNDFFTTIAKVYGSLATPPYYLWTDDLEIWDGIPTTPTPPPPVGRVTSVLTYGQVPTSEMQSKLGFSGAWGELIFNGTGDPATVENAWNWSGNLGRRLLEAGIQTLIGSVARSGAPFGNLSYETVLLRVRNHVQLSFNHPEIKSMYLNDFFGQTDVHGRTKTQWQEIISIIRQNPALKIIIPYTTWYRNDPRWPEFLSGIDFDEVIVNWHPPTGSQPITDFDVLLDEAKIMFPGRPLHETVWVTYAYDVDLLSEADFKHCLYSAISNFDNGEIIDIRFASLPNLEANLQYVDWIEEALATIPTPLSPIRKWWNNRTPLEKALTVTAIASVISVPTYFYLRRG